MTVIDIQLAKYTAVKQETYTSSNTLTLLNYSSSTTTTTTNTTDVFDTH